MYKAINASSQFAPLKNGEITDPHLTFSGSSLNTKNIFKISNAHENNVLSKFFERIKDTVTEAKN